MRIALFDVEKQLVQLARAAALAKGHAITLFCEPGEWGAEILQLFPSATLVDQWESLLVDGKFDVLVVGSSQRDIPTREDLLRRAVQEGVPLVAVQPAADSLVMHELAMIQKDTRSLLAPWNESREHPAAQRIVDFARGTPVSQLILQRHLVDASRAHVFAQLTRDADLLQAIAGPLDRVTALGPRDAGKLSSLAVTFAGTSEALIQWVLQPPGSAPGGKLTINAGTRRGELAMRDAAAPWNVQLDDAESPDDSHHAECDAGTAMLDTIAHAMAEDPTAPNVTARWKEACHAAELAEAAQQSLRRGRTIQLHFEERSEQQTFKGVMAIGGCLVLLLTLAVLGICAVIDALGLPFRNNFWWRLWPLYVLAPAVLLLAAQSLWRVFAYENTCAPQGDSQANPND